METSVRKLNFKIPYDEIDRNIVGLVKLFNQIPGIYTFESCGGHRDNQIYQNPENEWIIFFNLESNKMSGIQAKTWRSYELLVYAVQSLKSMDYQVRLSVKSYYPDPERKTSSIYFYVEGKDFAPDAAEPLFREQLEDILIKD